MSMSLSQYELMAVAEAVTNIEILTTGYGPGDTAARVVSAIIEVGDQHVRVGYDEAGDLCLLGEDQ